MKKLFVLILALVLVVALCACQTTKPVEESKETSTESTPAAESETESEAESEAESKAEESKEESKAEESKADESKAEESKSDEPEIPAYDATRFVYFGNEVASNTSGAKTAKTDIGTSASVNHANAIRLTAINEGVEYGSVVFYNAEFGLTIKVDGEDYADYAILVAEWNQDRFNYVFKKYYAEGANEEKANLAIPEDGFVVVAHKDNPMTAKLAKVTEGMLLVPNGIPTYGLEETISKATTAPTIDGEVSALEYGNALWVVDEKNKFWAYSDFVEGEYYATAEVYMTYDDDKLYVGVVVDSPYHHCPLTAGGASGMWAYECIQVNVGSIAPDDELMAKNFDWNLNPYLGSQKIFTQLGFGVSSTDGTPISCAWIGNTLMKYDYVGKRDKENEKTVYEFAIAWDQIGGGNYVCSGETGSAFSFAVSVNSTNESSGWRNIFMRNGGGIIGRNDFSKSAKIILG